MTDREALFRILKEIVPADDILPDAPAARYTTFRAGGCADFLVTVRSTADLRAVMKALRGERVPCVMLGNGSNLLVSDKGFHGVLIRLQGGMFEELTTGGETEREAHFTAGSALPLSVLARTAAAHGVGSFVPLSGIPGSVGGAITMNAGAYGGEIRDVITYARALDPEAEGMPEITLSKEDLALGYRTSIAKKRPLVFLGAAFAGAKTETAAALAEQINALAAQRKEKQPLDYPSAGSTFKRPAGAFAARLIEEAGLKGFAVGGARVSEKHAGFVVNQGGASATDILTLMREVRARVERHSGILLEPEVVILGETL